MKLYILTLSLILGTKAHADSMTWQIGAIDALVQTRGNLVLDEAMGVMFCHYCTISTCAGGPVERTVLSAKLTALNSTTYQLTVSGGINSSRHPFKSLKGCGYTLAFKGHDSQKGLNVVGGVDLAYSLKKADYPFWENRELAQDLSEAFTMKPLQLEIIKKGFTEPAIYQVEKK